MASHHLKLQLPRLMLSLIRITLVHDHHDIGSPFRDLMQVQLPRLMLSHIRITSVQDHHDLGSPFRARMQVAQYISTEPPWATFMQVAGDLCTTSPLCS